MRLRPWEGLTVKTALVLGFGTTVALWLIVGFQSADHVRAAQREAALVNERYMTAQERLSSARTHVLLGSVYVRDALLDPDPASVPGYRRNLEQAYRAADTTLQQYVPVLHSFEELPRIAGLRREIEGFRQAAIEALSSDRRYWSTEARVILNRGIGSKRDSVVRISDQIQAINRAAFVQQQTELTRLYAGAQRQVWERLGLALGASLSIALIATMYVVRLERDLRTRRAKELRAAEDLHELSARLVTAQEEERRAIARELHDEVGQVLTAIKVELSLAQRAIEATGGSRQLLDDAQRIADGALTTVRDLSHLLHPSLLDDLGLSAAMEWYVNGLSKRHTLRVDLVQEGMDERLAPEIESTAFRIIQEALTNVVKHANASSCYVYLGRFNDLLRLVVQDNGCGFDPDSIDPGQRRLGLVGIRERACHRGGLARVESSPGRGTRLIVELPGRVRPTAADADEPGSEVAVHALPDPEMLRG